MVHIKYCVYVCVRCADVSFSKLDLRARRAVIAEKVGSVLNNAPQDNVKNVTGLLDPVCMCVYVHACTCMYYVSVHVCKCFCGYVRTYVLYAVPNVLCLQLAVRVSALWEVL